MGWVVARFKALSELYMFIIQSFLSYSTVKRAQQQQDAIRTGREVLMFKVIEANWISLSCLHLGTGTNYLRNERIFAPWTSNMKSRKYIKNVKLISLKWLKLRLYNLFFKKLICRKNDFQTKLALVVAYFILSYFSRLFRTIKRAST